MDEWSGMWLKWRSICSKDRYQPAEYHGDAALPLAFSEGPHLFLDPSRKTACEASMGNSDDDYNGGQLVVVAVIFLALTYISVFLRFFVRLVITKSFSADDWLMLAAQTVFTLSCSFILRGVHDGLGRHNLSLPQGNRIKALEYQTLATTTYVANMMFIKLSIAVFLLRIAVQKRYVWTLKISMAIITIWSLAIFLYEIFQCSPVAAQWDFTIQPAKCVSGDSFVAAAYSISVMTIISDWLYAIIPIPMIWSVKMTAQKKLTVSFVLSLGIFASIATLIRLKFLVELADTSDILFTGTTAMVWTLVEPGIAITAASLITIRPLLRALNFKGFDSTDPYTNYPSRSRQTPGTNNLSLRSDLPPGHWQNITSSSGPSKGDLTVPERSKKKDGSRVQTRAVAEDSSSEEYILQGVEEEGIRRTVDVTVSRDTWSMRNGVGGSHG